MGMRDKFLGDAAAVAEYEAALAEMAAVNKRNKAAGIREETDEWAAANSRVLRAEKNVPWYRR